ncbi:MAG: hypothetical protein IKY83_03115, partial [Proteobacteria bacterium]|nr:hypothetical protein [Pseudomonadota bacterium]
PDAEIPSTTDDTGPKADPVAPVKTSDDAAPAAEQIKPIPNSELTIGSDEVIFPEIAIQVHLDQDSHKRLLENRETIIIQGYLEVYPNDPLPKQYQNEMDSDGSLTIAQARVETDPDNTAVILKDMKCNRKLYDALPQNDRDHIELLVNVFSGRKSSDLNLLDCGIVSGTIHEVKGKEHDISCKLIDPIQ